MTSVVESFTRDLRHALRAWRTHPAFTGTAILSLAAGIGAATAMFSVVYALLLNPFPYAVDRLVQLGMWTSAAPQPLSITARQWVELRQSEVLEDAIVQDGWPMTLTGADLPEAVPALYYSANALTMLGMQPLLGRLFTEADGPPGQVPQRVVVLTYRFWRRHFAGRSEAIGQTLRLNREIYTVIGVLPSQYFESGAEIIVPIHLTFDPDFSWMVQARLKPGVSPQQAEERLQPLVARFAQESPARFPKDFRRIQVRSILDIRRAAGFAPTLVLILAAAVLLLLLACANVAILLLAKNTARSEEFAVRSAVGASRSRLVAQLLTESLLLALSGAALGTVAAYYGTPAMLAMMPNNALPTLWPGVQLSPAVLGFSVGLATLSAVLCGIAPAFSLSRFGGIELMHTSSSRTIGGRSVKRLRYLLLTSQVALTVVLLAGTGGAVRTLLDLYRTPLGYNPHNLLVASLMLPDGSYRSWGERSAFYARLREEVERTPQTGPVALTVFAGVPPRAGSRMRIELPGREIPASKLPLVQQISPQYFATMQIPLVEGRIWSEAESARAAHVAVVNKTMAHDFWPAGDAIGQRVQAPQFRESASQWVEAAAGLDGWFEIVGVVGDTPNVGLHEPPAPAMYVPHTLLIGDAVTLVARTTRDPMMLERSVREAIRRVDPNQPINMVRTADQVLAEAGWARERFATLLLVSFAGFALLLAAVGLYSVVSYAVAQRVREFGVRMALGASRLDVVRTSLRSAGAALVTGLAAGLGLAIVSGRLLARWAVSTADDPLVLAGISAVLIVIAVMAVLIPAQRAASIPPSSALRAQ